MGQLLNKSEIATIGKALNLLKGAVLQTEETLPEGMKYVTDKLSGTVTELGEIHECLELHGQLDQDLLADGPNC